MSKTAKKTKPVKKGSTKTVAAKALPDETPFHKPKKP